MCFQKTCADLWPWPLICTSYSFGVFINVKRCSMGVNCWKMNATTCYRLQMILAKDSQSFLKESCNQAQLASHPTRSTSVSDRKESGWAGGCGQSMGASSCLQCSYTLIIRGWGICRGLGNIRRQTGPPPLPPPGIHDGHVPKPWLCAVACWKDM